MTETVEVTRRLEPEAAKVSAPTRKHIKVERATRKGPPKAEVRVLRSDEVGIKHDKVQIGIRRNCKRCKRIIRHTKEGMCTRCGNVSKPEGAPLLEIRLRLHLGTNPVIKEGTERWDAIQEDARRRRAAIRQARIEAEKKGA
jgi:hypothetical protein